MLGHQEGTSWLNRGRNKLPVLIVAWQLPLQRCLWLLLALLVCCRMVHGLLLDGGNEFLIKLSAEGADSKGAEGAGTAAAAAAAGADTDAVRDGGSGGSKPSAGSADCMDMALMTEADTYRDFHSAFVVSEWCTGRGREGRGRGRKRVREDRRQAGRDCWQAQARTQTVHEVGCHSSRAELEQAHLPSACEHSCTMRPGTSLLVPRPAFTCCPCFAACCLPPQVDNLQLPPGLSTHTAASIEFVGRAVRLLKSAPASAKLREMQDAWGSYNQHQLQLQEALAGLSGLQGGSSTGAGGGMPQQLLPYGDAMAYAAALRLLQDQPEYSPGALERTVEAIRADVRSWGGGRGGGGVLG